MMRGLGFVGGGGFWRGGFKREVREVREEARRGRGWGDLKFERLGLGFSLSILRLRSVLRGLRGSVPSLLDLGHERVTCCYRGVWVYGAVHC